MKDSTMFIWGILVVSMLSIVFAIGVYEKINKDRLTIERSFKEATSKYLKEHDTFPKNNESVVITYEDLRREEFIDELEYEGRLCKGNVTVSKIVFFYKYEPNISCGSE